MLRLRHAARAACRYVAAVSVDEEHTTAAGSCGYCILSFIQIRLQGDSLLLLPRSGTLLLVIAFFL